jgi:hypothetical protein
MTQLSGNVDARKVVSDALTARPPGNEHRLGHKSAIKEMKSRGCMTSRRTGCECKITDARDLRIALFKTSGIFILFVGFASLKWTSLE